MALWEKSVETVCTLPHFAWDRVKADALSVCAALFLLFLEQVADFGEQFFLSRWLGSRCRSGLLLFLLARELADEANE